MKRSFWSSSIRRCTGQTSFQPPWSRGNRTTVDEAGVAGWRRRSNVPDGPAWLPTRISYDRPWHILT